MDQPINTNNKIGLGSYIIVMFLNVFNRNDITFYLGAIMSICVIWYYITMIYLNIKKHIREEKASKLKGTEDYDED